MHLSTCVKQILVLHHQVRRGLVGSYRQDLARSQLGMAPHLCAMPWATKVVYTASVFPSQQGGSVCRERGATNSPLWTRKMQCLAQYGA